MDTEFGRIDREIQVAAPPEVVFDVVSRPEHIRQWWSDEAAFEPVSGGGGNISFVSKEESAETTVEGFLVLEVDPPRRFVFRWGHEAGTTACAANSFHVVFELIPHDGGTLLRVTETGFRERGWQAAVLEWSYRDHIAGWDHFLPRLAGYVTQKLAQR